MSVAKHELSGRLHERSAGSLVSGGNSDVHVPSSAGRPPDFGCMKRCLLWQLPLDYHPTVPDDDVGSSDPRGRGGVDVWTVGAADITFSDTRLDESKAILGLPTWAPKAPLRAARP